MRRIIAFAAFFCVFSSVPAFAKQPAKTLVWSDATVIRYNPLGLITAAEGEFQFRLYESDNPALETNYLGIGFTPKLTPAFSRFGPKLEIMPLSLLRLGVQYEFITYFGTFDYFQSFESPTDDVSEAAIETNAEADEEYVSSGTQLSFLGLLQAKVGPIAVRTKATVFRSDYRVRNDHPVFYDPFLDVMLPAQGWAWTNDLDALYVSDKLIAGLRYSTVQSYLPDIETADDPNSPIHRVGPLVLYSVHSSEGTGLNSVQLLGLFQWYITHRYRTGEETTQALPYIGVGALLKGKIF